MKITITTNCDAVVVSLQDYAAQIPKAMVRAMNRAIGSGRTAMVKEIARDMKLKAKVVRDKLEVRDATINRPVASLSAPLKRLPLAAFGARQVGRGVSVDTGPGGGGRHIIRSAFLAKMRSDHVGVFVRTGKKRLPIRELPGVSIGHVFNKYRQLGILRVEETFVKNFERELVFAKGEGQVTRPVVDVDSDA